MKQDKQGKPDKPVEFASRAPARYQLSPNDVIELHYRYTPEFNQSATVQPDGFISLQLLGNLAVGGQTLEAARATILKAAAARLNNPDLSITLTSFQKPYFTVAGEVGSPGRIELQGSITAVEAIAMAGGFKQDRAKNSQVILFRRVSSDMAQTRILNIKKIVNEGHFEEDVAMVAGDLLVVRQNSASKVERFVHWANIGMFLNPLQ